MLKQIKGFPNYRISDLGQVYNQKGTQLKLYVNDNGRYNIKLVHNGFRKGFQVHRLVALHFIENPNNYLEVNHKNGDPKDNRVENLEWCNHQYNVWHRENVINHGTSRKIEYQNIIFKNQRAVADYLGISYASVSQYLNGSLPNKYNLKVVK